MKRYFPTDTGEMVEVTDESINSGWVKAYEALNNLAAKEAECDELRKVVAFMEVDLTSVTESLRLKKDLCERLRAELAEARKTSWPSSKQYIAMLESFMACVAKELKCLPSYADPTPDGGNAHIIGKLRELAEARGRTWTALGIWV